MSAFIFAENGLFAPSSCNDAHSLNRTIVHTAQHSVPYTYTTYRKSVKIIYIFDVKYLLSGVCQLEEVFIMRDSELEQPIQYKFVNYMGDDHLNYIGRG